MIGLYKNAELVVIPTLYEAGSAPLYEAMRYQVPVICSNTTSLPETIGDKRFIFDAENINSISELILKIITDDEMRKANIQNSINRMKELVAYDYLAGFIDVYKKLLIDVKQAIF